MSDGSNSIDNAAQTDSSGAVEPPNTDPNNIVLTGFMGTGKSTVGRMLARQLQMQFVDTDRMIERRHGPIPRIFEEQGESGFRDIERAIAKELSTDVGFVISTGGRFMLDADNVALLRPGNRIFCLVAEFEVVMERVMRRRSTRPLLAVEDPAAVVKALMEERAEGYAQFEAVTTDEREATLVVEDILSRL